MPDRPLSRTPVQPSPARRTRRGLAGTHDGRCRVVIEHVRPEIDTGRFPIKRVVGETVQVTAWVHADGHDVLSAVVQYRPVPAHGRPAAWQERALQPLGNDEWTATFDIEEPSAYEYTVQAWVDHFATWRKGLAAKVGAQQDVSSELLEGAAMLRLVAHRAVARRDKDAGRWLEAQADLIGGPADMAERARVALEDRLAALARRFQERSHAVAYERVLTVAIDRERARFGAWYEMFPRSWGPDPTRSATFGEAEAHLARVAAMGFDVVYLPPIHPIGTTFRKGRGNSLTPGVGDPGSPWAIGSDTGGHKSVDPGLGTLDDFDHFVGEARRLGLEIALDIAFQCSPDHPYVRDHPEWFRHRPDGTIKYAENPPKKYQDIYPFDFECDAWESLWQELKSVVTFWAARNVRIFRVDNPHTKPYRFWEWLIREVRAEYPDAIFLAEAFTRPKVMSYLAKLGFTQSYTYFTWRNTRDELVEYFTELTRTESAEIVRPNLFANTPDILHEYLQKGGPPAFRIRLLLAATLGATYGIYSGFELCEGRAVSGSEEYLDSEKYQYRQWDWDRPGHIRDLVTTINGIRRENPALHSNESLTFCDTDNPHLIAYYKRLPDRSNAVLVVINLDWQHMQHGWVNVPTEALGLPLSGTYDVVDLLTGAPYTWRGSRNYVRLDPGVAAGHVFQLPAAAPDVIRRTSAALPEVLPSLRWFAGKARTITSARVDDWSSVGQRPGGLISALAHVEYADAGGEDYFMPIVVVPDADARRETARAIAHGHGVTVIDALDDDEACRALVGVILDGHPMAMRHGVLRPRAYGTAAAPDALPIVRGALEQSNSCVRFDDRYLLKVIRRLEAGPHPELEISRFLTRRGCAFVPPLLGSLEYERPDEEPTTIALLQAFVANDGTAWSAAEEDARAFVVHDPAAPGAAAVGYLEPARRLGQRTGEMHRALASDPEDPAFSPEPLTQADCAALVAAMQASAARSLARLTGRLDALPETAREAARAVIDAQALLAHRLERLTMAPEGSLRTRVHGDYHLGQVLAVGGDFVIIDFEGEPARTLTERRAKQSPLKDVAGMLRSFSYAAYAARLTAREHRPDLLEQLEPRAQVWASAVASAFLAGYRQATAGAGLVPEDADGFTLLLDAFVLDKALYEVGYELANRPGWVTIPLLGILRILRAPSTRVGS